jgi:NADH-quinone oxidoreductase subunit C
LDRGELTLTIAAGEIRAAAATVQAAGYNFFEDLTAVDWFPSSPRFQLSYHILSHAYKERIRLRVLVEDDSPAVESITAVWPSANFYEREVFDLFGVRFEGHPNLRRIMMPDDWQGHPLRKDYPVEGYR